MQRRCRRVGCHRAGRLQQDRGGDVAGPGNGRLHQSASSATTRRTPAAPRKLAMFSGGGASVTRVSMTSGASTRTGAWRRSEEHTSELQSLMRTSYAVFCLKKKTTNNPTTPIESKLHT